MTPIAKRATVAVPVLVITFGVGWLMQAHEVGGPPAVGWIWVLMSAVLGVVVVAVAGLDKLTAVLGPMLVLIGLLIYLFQRGLLDLRTEVPLAIIVLGALMLGSRLSNLPRPNWLIVDEDRSVPPEEKQPRRPGQ
jgi:hypothetical protein